nr:VOC family protein [Lentibacter algarum]
MTFDHLVIGAERLEDGVAWAQERLGVPLEGGGNHARYGTHNALLGLENGAYLEVIAVDPDAEAEHLPRWFGLDGFESGPRLLTWVCSTQNLSGALPRLPEGFSGIAELSRGDLHWKMAEAQTGVLPFDQCFPGIIDWGTTPHPATRLKTSGIVLERLELQHPEAGKLRSILADLLTDDRVHLSAQERPHLSATLRRPDGSLVTL